MKFHVIILIVLLANCADYVHTSLRQLSEMVKFSTGQKYAKFAFYGNWCGIGGSGETVDDIDACCKTHDLCYESLKSLNSDPNSPATTRYRYKVASSQGKIVCSSSAERKPFLRGLCDCDNAFAECLKLHHSKYDETKVNITSSG